MTNQHTQSWHFNRRVILQHVVFWVIMYIYYMVSNWTFMEDKVALAERFFVKTVFQILLSYIGIYVLIPRLLNKNKKVLFVLSSLFAVYIFYVIYTAYRVFYYDLKYFGAMRRFDFFDRIVDFSFYLNELTWFILPAIVLVMLQYYKDQKEVWTLREQKKSTELNLLKNQLNPHFLFNTLNNLYTLALKKSDKTPEVIAKLSAILDYMLYHCQEKYVSLTDEITLINNYLELEKLRYGKRLDLSFDHQIDEKMKIAPLILLTFVENAFKHGVKEEIGVASISIQLRTDQKEILFEIENSKPINLQKDKKDNGTSLGLQNIRKQLDILYPDRYVLNTDESNENYAVTLKLTSNGL